MSIQKYLKTFATGWDRIEASKRISSTQWLTVHARSTFNEGDANQTPVWVVGLYDSVTDTAKRDPLSLMCEANGGFRTKEAAINYVTQRFNNCQVTT